MSAKAAFVNGGTVGLAGNTARLALDDTTNPRRAECKQGQTTSCRNSRIDNAKLSHDLITPSINKVFVPLFLYSLRPCEFFCLNYRFKMCMNT